MSDSARLPARSAVVVLFVVAACAVLTAGGLTAVVLADDDPRQAPTTAVGERPSPTARPASTREPAPPMCLIGSWRSADEKMMIKFYNNEDPILFTTGGRLYEFRPDHTGTERMDNVVFSGTFEGNELRLVGNGSSDFTWSATDKAVTYVNRTRSEFTWSYYDQRGLILTEALPPNRPVNITDDYACQGSRIQTSNPATAFQAAWARTATFGMYG